MTRHARPSIGERCHHRGRYSEVCAIFTMPTGLRVVGRYFRARRGVSHFVDEWVNCDRPDLVCGG